MSKHLDASGAGRSKLIPFDPDESAAARHERRLQENLKAVDELKAWCKERNVDIRISNEGQHWRFKYWHSIAEWWPSSAKLVFNKNWDSGIHVHDYQQLKAQLIDHWNLVASFSEANQSNSDVLSQEELAEVAKEWRKLKHFLLVFTIGFLCGFVVGVVVRHTAYPYPVEHGARQ